MPKPQVVKTDTGKVNLIRPVPQLENLVLRGGGVKGIGNPPALIEMDKAGMLGGLKHIVGTSAGALTALCLASGTTTTDFQTLSDTHSPLSLRDNPSNWKKLYPMVEFGVKGYNAVNALQLADKTSAESVSAYLNNNWDTDGFKDKLKTLTDEQRARLAELRNPDLTTNRTGKMVTFKDLETLHQLAPDTFKELTLTGFDETHKTVRYFNATDYPDMPIAIAGRISMSIPQAFAAVNYDPGDGNKKRYFVDGGVGSNMPSEVLTRTTPSDASTELQGRERENVLVRTGIMTFDEGGDEAYQKTLKNIDHNKKVQSTPEPTGFWEKLKPREKEVEVTPLKGAYKAMHGSPQENIIPDSGWMEQTAAGNNIGAVDRWDQKKMAESAANCFVIAHGTLDTGSFIHLQSTADQAKLQASDLMKSQVDNLKDYGAYAQTFDTMDEAYGVLTKAEKEEILKAAPDPQTYAKGDQDPGYKADLELYKKVETEHLKEQQQQQQGQQVDDGNVPKPSVSVRDSMSKSPSSDDAHTNLKLEEVDADEPKVESPKGSVTVKEALGKSLNTTTTTTTKVDGTTKVTL